MKHGTRQGYDKHRRVRKGTWKWPLGEECGCREAYRAYQREYMRQTGNARKGTRERNNARQRAYKRLQHEFPQLYAKYYAEELSVIRDGGTVVLANLRAELRATLRGMPPDLESVVRSGHATPREREVYLKACALKSQIAEVEQRIAAREPGSDS